MAQSTEGVVPILSTEWDQHVLSPLYAEVTLVHYILDIKCHALHEQGHNLPCLRHFLKSFVVFVSSV